MTKKFKVSKCFEVWNDEAFESGDTDERGFTYEDLRMTAREIIEEIVNNGIQSASATNWRKNIKNVWLTSIDDNHDYQTGNTTYFSLHIKASNRQLKRIYRLAGVQ